MKKASFYPLIRKILFQLNPETAHHITLHLLKWAEKIGLTRFLPPKTEAPIEAMGLRFPNRAGLSAGFDKNGEYIDALASLGFGFIEVGTITPKPQPGNPKPRLFRLVKEEAIINRLGFNNKGVDYLVEQLKKTKYQGILGINIGKNKDTPIEKAIEDYLYCMKRALPFASYITINISSPNTENLRQLQHGDLLKELLSALKKEQAHFLEKQKKYIPLIVKISPDLTSDELKSMADIFLSEKIDGVIATNTTLSRDGITSTEIGGLSGKPLTARSTAIIRELHALLENQIPIIGCGGISNKKDADERIAAGATLLQVYTGLIYQGASLVKEMA